MEFGYPGRDYWLEAYGSNLSNTASDYSWEIGSNDPYELPMTVSGRRINFRKSDPGNYLVSLKYNGICGWSLPTYREIMIVGGGVFSLIPNPASDYVTVSMEDMHDIQSYSVAERSNSSSSYTIQLWSSFGLLKSVQTDLEAYQLDLHGVPAGFYYVLVIKDGQTFRKQLIVK